MKENGEEKKEANQNLTSDQGVRINHTDDSLKAGLRGPTLMEDFHFREKITHFDHERIPERVVHARGSAAHGYFQSYVPIKGLTKALFLNDTSVKTPVFVRFSTVVGFRGSADTVRDVRGFATKFYTKEGNFDLVGNNIPVFFIQDGIKFPDLVHAIKPEPHNEMPQASAAHDNFWDFTSLMPETMHMIMWVLSDRALPRSYAMMEGFGVHTFRMINEEGKSTFVKFHWKPLLGMHSLAWDEVQKLAGKDPDFNRRDLWDRIEKGDYPEYELGVQIVEEDNEFDFAFDLLDATKIIPEELVPVQKIGRMVLDRNPDNFFAETEQVAFHPGNLVPGIDVTNDPLLQGRLFSYLDTQLNRFSSANFTEIPINRPHADVTNNQRDGFMRQTVNKGRVNYTPNSLAKGCPYMSSFSEGGYVHHPQHVEGNKVRERSNSFKDFFSQATMFYNSMSEAEKKHIISAFHFELGKVNTMEIRERMVNMLTNVDLKLSQEVAKGIGLKEPMEMVKVKGVDYEVIEKLKEEWKHKKSVISSPALSMESTIKDTIKTRKIAILVEDGFDYKSLKEVKEFLMKEGATIEIVSETFGEKKSMDGQMIDTDKSHLTTASIMYDAVLIPAGQECLENLQKQGDAIHFINEAFKHCKPIGAISEGVGLLKKSDIPDMYINSNNVVNTQMGIISMNGSGNYELFKSEFKTAIAQHRHWSREQMEMVPA
ncbi:MAG TPA: catalase [Bacteroidia bacterium]|nr:catalase [Bacteroidia bacterium]